MSIKSLIKQGIDSNLISKYRTELMGIAIIWVVLFHSNIPAPESTVLRLLWYLLISFGGGIGVDIFFIVSGFGLTFSHAKSPCYGKNGEYWTFIRKRLLRVFIPFLLVALVCFGIVNIVIGTDVLKFLSNVSLLSFFIEGERTYWYIAATLIFYCFFPLLMWLSDKFGTVKTHLVVCACTVAFEFVSYYLLPAFYEKLEIAIIRFIPFIIGSLIGRLMHEGKMPKPNLWLTGITAVASIILMLVLIKLQLIDNRGGRYLFILISLSLVYLFSYIFGVIPIKFRVLNFFGKYSLEVYLLHIALASLPNLAFKLFGLQINAFLEVAIVIAISALLGLLLKKASNILCGWITKKCR